MTRRQVRNHGGQALFHQYPSLEEALRALYPQHPWDSFRFSSSARALLQPAALSLTTKEQAELLQDVGRAIGIKQVLPPPQFCS